jgi:hypothetical protein
VREYLLLCALLCWQGWNMEGRIQCFCNRCSLASVILITDLRKLSESRTRLSPEAGICTSNILSSFTCIHQTSSQPLSFAIL